MKNMVSRRQFVKKSIGVIGGILLLNSGCIRSAKKEYESTALTSDLKLFI